ncbi:MAG: diacylglycerol kinase [Gemmatimonadaceae bacterium]|nr:diacylglycerol kinase [Gemmatimonadaceae bacterium]
MSDTPSRIPAIINSASGSAEASRAALATNDAFQVREVPPHLLTEAVKEAAAAATGGRVLIAGGDGTIATAATALMGTPVEMAILPGGTLNHFARDLGIEADASAALLTAVAAGCRPVDIGEVNGHFFLNTSSVGAYVHFVREREKLERTYGYLVASGLAALRALGDLRSMRVSLEIDGATRVYRTPLVFIGVGERELQLPTIGKRVTDGRQGLHVMIVRSQSRARLLAVALSAAALGVESAAKSPEFDSFIVDSCSITLGRRRRTVALDGELLKLESPLEFRNRRDAITVVCPPRAPDEVPG